LGHAHLSGQLTCGLNKKGRARRRRLGFVNSEEKSKCTRSQKLITS
jgi:hypothetical protein